MKNRMLLLLACSVVFAGSLSHSQAQGTSIQDKLIGKWTQHYTGMSLQGAILNITSVDPATGQLKGKYSPPAGAAAGKEFDVIGWVSSAPPFANRDNVIVISFSVSLNTYGSIATWTGFLKENKIIASSSNARSNAGYEWDHVTATYDVWTKNP